MSYWDLSSANPDCAKSIEGTKREPFSRAVHSEYGTSCCDFWCATSWGAVREDPLVIGAHACFEAMKLERRALISSTFDFSEAGRRVIEGPPFMMLLNMVSDCVIYHVLRAPYEVERMSLVMIRSWRYFRPLVLLIERHCSISVVVRAVGSLYKLAPSANLKILCFDIETMPEAQNAL